MDFRFFFEGKLGRENAASAFLAMALEGSPTFRAHFFEAIAGEDSDALLRNWRGASVEVGHVDITLDCGDTIILIENKIDAGAQRPRQLLNYYDSHVRNHPERRAIFVFLAPGELGRKQVDAVKKSCKDISRNDKAVQLSWEDVLSFEPVSDDRWLRGGFAAIKGAIDRAVNAVYPVTGAGDRGPIRELVNKAYDTITTEMGNIAYRWSGKGREHILTKTFTLTLGVRAEFETTSESPFQPLGTRSSDGRLQVQVSAVLHGRADVSKKSPEGQWWREQAAKMNIEVPGVGTFANYGIGKFKYAEPHLTIGSSDEISAHIVDLFKRLVFGATLLMQEAGLELQRKQ